jgi:carotenoid cleavage dioxygenase-like enzyme
MATVAAHRTTFGPQAGLRSLSEELTPTPLPVQGELPAWLSGSLLRNGPALFEDRRRSVNHWFDGQAMLHRFTVDSGRVVYANRFLRTRAYAAMREGEISFSEFATDPCRSIFGRLMTVFDPQITDNTAVSVTRLGEQHLAMTEAPISVQFDPDSLATLGYGHRMPGTFATAHPHRDPSSGALINLATVLGPHNRYRLVTQDPGAAPRIFAERRVTEPGYMHSFAMSERFLALTEFPFTVRSIEIPLRGRPFIENFRVRPDRGTRILVFRRGSGDFVGEFEAAPGFAFHHVGAWDDDGRLVMEYCDHGSPAIIDALYLDRLRRRSERRIRGDAVPARLRRDTIDLASGRVDTAYRADHDIELPRINDARCYLRPYRYVYGIATGADSTYDTADRLVKLDTRIGEATTWSQPDSYVGEPVFVPAPDSRAEDDGVLLSVVLDARTERSSLIVLDAATMHELGRAEAPHAIPFGFHGNFYAAQAD